MAFVASGLAALVTVGTARAQETASRDLRYDWGVDAPIAGGALALWFASELLKGTLAPRACRVCDRRRDGSDDLDAPDAVVRAALRWNAPAAADVISDVTGFALAPAASLGGCEIAAAYDGRSRDAPANALVVIEAAALAADLDQIAKLLVGRQRPLAHFRLVSVEPRNPDDNLSFYSGHTSLAFSLAVASGTVASLRGYRLAPAVWAGSLPVAVVTGYLRIAADKHYLSDVLAGAVVGSAVGFLVPFVFHRVSPSTAGPQAGTDAAGAALRGPFFSGSWTF
jgi:membrane-associated phospholipid phosphatase